MFKKEETPDEIISGEIEGLNEKNGTSKEGREFVSTGILVNGVWHNKLSGKALGLTKGDKVKFAVKHVEFNGKTQKKVLGTVSILEKTKTEGDSTTAAPTTSTTPKISTNGARTGMVMNKAIDVLLALDQDFTKENLVSTAKLILAATIEVENLKEEDLVSTTDEKKASGKSKKMEPMDINNEIDELDL